MLEISARSGVAVFRASTFKEMLDEELPVSNFLTIA
jgi:hypothetical protein